MPMVPKVIISKRDKVLPVRRLHLNPHTSTRQARIARISVVGSGVGVILSAESVASIPPPVELKRIPSRLAMGTPALGLWSLWV